MIKLNILFWERKLKKGLLRKKIKKGLRWKFIYHLYKIYIHRGLKIYRSKFFDLYIYFFFTETTETIVRNITHAHGKPVLNYLRWLREVRDIEKGLFYIPWIKIKELQRSTNASVQKLNIVGSIPNSIVASFFMTFRHFIQITMCLSCVGKIHFISIFTRVCDK